MQTDHTIHTTYQYHQVKKNNNNQQQMHDKILICI